MSRSENKSQTIPVATRITKPMHDAILNLLQVNAHVNVADYVRDLIRRDLEKKGVFPVEAVEKDPTVETQGSESA